MAPHRYLCKDLFKVFCSIFDRINLSRSLSPLTDGSYQVVPQRTPQRTPHPLEDFIQIKKGSQLRSVRLEYSKQHFQVPKPTENIKREKPRPVFNTSFTHHGNYRKPQAQYATSVLRSVLKGRPTHTYTAVAVSAV